MKRYIHASYSIEKIDSKMMAPYKGYNVEKSWTIDGKGRPIKDSVRYAVIDNDDDWIGDFYKTVKEAHDYIDTLTKKEVKASSRSIEANGDRNFYLDDGEIDIFSWEDDAMKDLGIYFDYSAIRFGTGTVTIFSDPNNKCNSDVWDGDDDAFLAEIDYQDYNEQARKCRNYSQYIDFINRLIKGDL